MIHYTKDFSKALAGLCAFSFFLAIMWILSRADFIGATVTSPLIPYYILKSLGLAGLWAAIAYATKANQAAAVAFCINILYLVLPNSLKNIGGVNYSHWINSLSDIAAFMTFGWMYFKEQKGLLLGIIALLLIGFLSSRGYSAYEYCSFFSNFGRATIGINSNSMVEYMTTILGQSWIPLTFIFFWSIFSPLKNKQQIDFSLRTISILKTEDKVTYSLIHWVTRISVVVILFSSFRFIEHIQFLNSSNDLSFLFIFKLVCYCLAVFVVGSIYRNTLVSFLIRKKAYPSWFYLFLNMPFIHGILWGILMFLPDKKRSILSNSPETESELGQIQYSQKNFVYKGRNAAIKTIIVILFVVGLVFILVSISAVSARNLRGMDPTFAVAIYVFNIILTIWYMGDRRAMYILFVMQSVLLMSMCFVNHQLLEAFVAYSSLVFLVINYALYHYDQFNFIDNDVEHVNDVDDGNVVNHPDILDAL